MVDAVALYATAMNDLGNVESIPIEPLNCKGGAVWSGGDTFLRYLKGVSTVDSGNSKRLNSKQSLISKHY